TKEKAIEKIRKKYGDRVNILRTQRNNRSFFFGLIERVSVEIFFSVNSGSQSSVHEIPSVQSRTRVSAARVEDTEAEKIKILESAQRINAKIAQQVEPLISAAKEKKTEKVPTSPEAVHALTQTLEGMIQKITNSAPVVIAQELQSIQRIELLLEENDFSFSFIRKSIARLKDELSYHDLESFEKVESTVLRWIIESVHIQVPPICTGTRNIVLVGPTGVGKTTTLAKLAAFYFVTEPKRTGIQPRVKIITTDNFRIGAAFQMERYCELMGLDLCVVQAPVEFLTYMTLYQQETDVVFVDTEGRSPVDGQNIERMVEYFRAVKNFELEVYLTIDAGSKANDLREVFKQYALFEYRALIVTKLDETTSIGNLISALSEARTPITYITTGQTVPSNLEKASVNLLLSKLKGFKLLAEEMGNDYGDYGSKER
ncbi:flagellar biosynthesis protein FlhF, partial [Treponema pallidum]